MYLSTLELEKGQLETIKTQCPGFAVTEQNLRSLTKKERSEVEVLFTYGNDLTEELLGEMIKLQWIHIGQSGMDNLPVKSLITRNIVVTNSKGINSSNIAEYVLGMLLMYERRIFEFYEKQKAHEWDTEIVIGELRDKTIGILGMGMVGREIAKRAYPFSMRVLGMDLFPVEVEGVEKVYPVEELSTLLPQCDYLILCMPLTKENYHIISKEQIASMKDEAIIMNCGRGGLLDLSALSEALQQGKLASAVVDVFEKEPLESDSPLWDVPRLFITPHIAGDHFEAYQQRMVDLMIHNIKRYPDYNSMENKINLLNL